MIATNYGGVCTLRDIEIGSVFMAIDAKGRVYLDTLRNSAETCEQAFRSLHLIDLRNESWKLIQEVTGVQVVAIGIDIREDL